MDIIRIIQETATWIEKVNPDIETNLYRTAGLSPKMYYYQIPDEEKDQVVEDLVASRSAMLKALKVNLIPVDELVDYGRIMFFEANETLIDCAPEEASFCFIDQSDAPPWDTWIATERQLFNIDFWAYNLQLTDKMLIAWVPKSQYFYAQEAIAVAMLDNFKWPEPVCVSEPFFEDKYLFTEPPTTDEPCHNIDILERRRHLYRLMHDAEVYSKVYYKSSAADYKRSRNDKISFWKRLFGRG